MRNATLRWQQERSTCRAVAPPNEILRRLRSAIGVQTTAIKCCSHLAEPVGGQLAPVRELVTRLPAPRRDHRQHQDPALAQQVRIDTRIVLSDLFRCMSEVELDRSTTTRLKIYEDQPVPRAE